MLRPISPKHYHKLTLILITKIIAETLPRRGIAVSSARCCKVSSRSQTAAATTKLVPNISMPIAWRVQLQTRSSPKLYLPKPKNRIKLYYLFEIVMRKEFENKVLFLLSLIIKMM